MSHDGSEQEEAECWTETSLKTHHEESPSEWTQEGATMEDPPRPRWSIGVGKKQDWEGRTQRVALTHGNRKLDWKHEMELLYADNEVGEKPN